MGKILLFLFVVITGTLTGVLILFMATDPKRADFNQAAPQQKQNPEPKGPEFTRLKPFTQITSGEVALSIKSARIQLVSVKNFLGEIETSTESHLVLTVTTWNQSETKKIDFTPWRENLIKVPTLTDEFGNSYNRVSFSKPIIGAADRGSIHPGKSLTDLVIFEKPIDKATSLKLTLEGSNVGAEKDFLIELVAADWNNFKP